jgi:hypothetical protein
MPRVEVAILIGKDKKAVQREVAILIGKDKKAVQRERWQFCLD